MLKGLQVEIRKCYTARSNVLSGTPSRRIAKWIVSVYFINFVLNFSGREGLSEGFTKVFSVRKMLNQNQLAQRPEKPSHTFFLF